MIRGRIIWTSVIIVHDFYTIFTIIILSFDLDFVHEFFTIHGMGRHIHKTWSYICWSLLWWKLGKSYNYLYNNVLQDFCEIIAYGFFTIIVYKNRVHCFSKWSHCYEQLRWEALWVSTKSVSSIPLKNRQSMYQQI